MGAFIQNLSFLPVPLVAGLVCLGTLARTTILLVALTDQQRCNRLVRIIKA